jgi:hypothetical protein
LLSELWPPHPARRRPQATVTATTRRFRTSHDYASVDLPNANRRARADTLGFPRRGVRVV